MKGNIFVSGSDMVRKLEELEKELEKLEGAEIKINRFDTSPFYKDVKRMLREGTFDLKKDLRIL